MSSRTPFNQRYPIKNAFEYKGVLFGSVASSQEVVEQVPEFEVRENDVVVAAYPRTGTRWMAEILTWIAYDAEEEKVVQTAEHRCPYVEMSIEPMVPNALKLLSSMPASQPRLYGTHLRYEMAPRQFAEKGKIICILRNPKDAAVSFYHFYRCLVDFGPYEGTWADFLDGFSLGEVLYSSYFDFVKSWWQRKGQKNILFIRYEEMKLDPAGHVRKIAEFLGKSFSDDQVALIVEKTSFTSMKKNPNTNPTINPKMQHVFLPDRGSDVVRKGKVSDWKNHFTVAQNEEFDRLIEEQLKGTGLSFQY